MKAVVVGAGPVGVVTAIGLARQGYDVVVVDRDAGPSVDGSWDRVGVMQFHLSHGFRPQVHQVLSELMPDVFDTIVAHGAIPVEIPVLPTKVVSLCSRRETVERALRAALVDEPGVEMIVGHADEIAVADGKLTGVVVDGALLEAQVVVVATGRTGQLGRAYRAPADGGPCGMAYVNRMYQARPGVDAPLSPVPVGALGDGYLSLVFSHDDGIVSTLLVRRTEDSALAELRHNSVFDAVVPSIPNLAPYLDPTRWEPITDVMAGAGLRNSYQSVLASDGAPAVPGLFFLGDAVLTTNPQAGRGMATGLTQVREFLHLMGHTDDLAEVAVSFDMWCEQNMRPWFEDHVYWDSTLRSRWAGHDIDVDAPIASDVVCAAAAVDPEIAPAVMPFQAMLAGPRILDPFRERARAILKAGWRPPIDPGPSADHLTQLITAELVG